ncbi:MAG: RsmB/NOP family class I SAM-dependent RNA methyltransferase [Pseudomonadota bacterium]
MAQTGLPPRRAAWYLLQEITGEGRLMSELLGAGALDHLAPDDRARSQRLAVTTLRGLDRADRMLKPYLIKRPPLEVQNALRLGVIELCSGEAAHGVVNSYVEVVGRNKHVAKMKGLTNAVLRKIAAEGQAGWDNRAVPILPKWLRQPLVDAWGRKAVHGIEVAHFTGAPLDLTAKGDAAAVAQATGGTLLPNGSVRMKDAGQVSTLAGYDSGDWWVQDAAAAMPVQLVGDVQGRKVLDLCAAPGGKTLQLAAGGADVTAVDLSEGRMARVAENLARVGVPARTVVSDAFAFADGNFDVVLLDAPCSATGTIRRHPDLPYAKDGSEFGQLIEQQGQLIDHALTLLKPGGRLVFCTCSLLPDEGEVQVEGALARHPSVSVDREASKKDWIAPDWLTEEGGIRLRPDYWADLGGMDGFYMAVLTKS